MKKLTLLFAFTMLASFSFGQALSGTYKVGTGQTAPNFTSLSAAVSSLNTNGVAGDVILEITSDITEAANIGLGVNTSGHSITIRPDADADRTITFTQLADNASPTGHFVIGYTDLASAWADANTIATNNVTIDGYAVGGSTRRLTFKNTSANHIGARVIVVVGACENTVIKNCIVNNLTTNTSSPFCVGAVVRKGTLIDVAPNNLTIDNNILTALGNVVAMGMRFTNSNTPTTSITGLVIKNNTITSRRRLIEINYTNGAEISNNEFKQQQTGTPGTISYGLWTSTAVKGTVKIHNNRFTEAFTEETGAFGLRVISLASGATYEVYNNMFAGLNKTKPSTVALNLTYLFYSGVSGKIYNNTFYMKALTDASSTGYYNAIQLSGNSAEIKNNIFISDEPTHTNTAFISAVPTPATDYNVFYLRQSHVGSKVVAAYTTFSDYRTNNPTKDVHSVYKDVTFANTATGDLSIAGASINDTDLAVPRLADVLKDIFGTDRATTTYAGAHEAYFTKTFTVTAPSGTEHVYVAGSFSDKNWDISNPHELTATGNPNEYSGSFPCVDGVEYKYLNGKSNWEYGEATAPATELGTNRTYNATDNVPYWKASPRVTLTATISENSGEPSDLFVKGGWNGWTDAVALSKQSEKVFTGSIGNGTSDVIYSNTEYKYLTSQLGPDNWEQRNDNRWMLYPAMNDEISKFLTEIPFTTVENVKSDIKIMRTSTGISVVLDGNANSIELYNMKGVLMERTQASGSYTRDLESGAYILRINGVGHKFVR